MSPIPQRYNLKAIHNKPRIMFMVMIGVTNTSKIQSESKIDGVKAIHNTGINVHAVGTDQFNLLTED